MIPDADLDRARSRLVDVIGADVALKPKGREFAGLCPFHDEKTPSFYVVADKSMWHCFGCGAHGDAIGFVMRHRSLDFVDAVRWLLDLPAIPAQAVVRNHRTSETEPNTADRIAEIMRGCGPITDRTAAHLYLWSRGLKTQQPALLAHPALYCHEIGKPLPALVAPITNSAGEVCAVQRIWCVDRIAWVGGECVYLNPDGSAGGSAKDARAPIQTRKKTLGRMGDGSVRLVPAGATLGLAEGNESGIAAIGLYRVPVWAVCGAARLGHVWIPPEVRSLIIFGDNGDTGRELAERAVSLWGERGVCVTAIFPDDQFGDFADMVIGRRGAA